MYTYIHTYILWPGFCRYPREVASSNLRWIPISGLA